MNRMMTQCNVSVDRVGHSRPILKWGNPKMRLNQILGSLLGGLLCSSVAYATDPPPFPRLGAMLFGSPTNYDNAALQAQIAKANIALFSYWCIRRSIRPRTIKPMQPWFKSSMRKSGGCILPLDPVHLLPIFGRAAVGLFTRLTLHCFPLQTGVGTDIWTGSPLGTSLTWWPQTLL